MDDLSRKFLLLQDRVGANVERSLLSLGLSTKQVPTQVLRGELLEALPEDEQPQDSLKIALGGIERKSLRVECALDCLMRLTEGEANLLLAISSLEERYQTYMDRIRLDFGKKIEMGSRVFVTVKGFPKKLPGVVWYKGDLSPGSGTMFGVELIEHPGQGASDGTFRNHQYFSCPPDSGVFVGLDKLTPRVDSEGKSTKKGESHQSSVVSRLKESIIPSSWKGKNEPDLYQGDVEYALKPDQRVVTFLDDKHPIRGSVRFIGKDKDRHGKTYTVVGLELDTRDGNCTGKLHGRQVFVCKRDFGVFVPIEAVIPEENFDGNSVKLQTSKQSEKGDNMQEQIRRDEELARSISCNGNSAGQGSMPTKRERANSVEEPASVMKAAGESSKTDPTEFIEQQRQQLKMLEMKRSKLSAHNYEDVDMQDDERTDSATKLNFDDTHFEQTLPNSTQRDNIPVTEQPGLSGVIPTKSYAGFVHIEQWEYEEVIKQHEARNAAGMHPGPRVDRNTRPPSATEGVTDFIPGTSSTPEDRNLSKVPTEVPVSQNVMLHAEEPASEKTTGADATGQSAVDNPHGFEVGTMVEVPMAGVPRYGVIKWIGPITQVKDKLVAGLELEDEQSACSDGTFNGERYFTCPAGRGFFTLLIHCRPDARFTHNSTGSQDNGVHSGKAFGSLPSPDVPGITEPPATLEDHHCGTMHGLQGHHNSCYLDATLYSMFAFSSVFDTLLHRQKRDTDLPEYEKVQLVLRESIVNPLRVNDFVRADKVLELRELLDKLSSTAGLVNEEKDPEEFLNSLLQQVLKADPFLQLKSRDVHKKDSEGAFFYQIITEKDESVKIAQVQQLLEQSFISADIILSEVPSCLILQMPRFGSRYKMYDMILPNLGLNVTNIVENVPRECSMCGDEVAQFECKSCFQKRMFGSESGIASYCRLCNDTVHSHRDRKDHDQRPLLLPRQYDSKKRLLEKQKMELFAVVCIETSHYVAFVKCGVGAGAPWCFFDSMADRKGERNGYNIPAVTRCPEALEWLSKDPKDILAAKEKGQIPEKVRRLLGDGYLCMYQDLDMTMYK